MGVTNVGRNVSGEVKVDLICKLARETCGSKAYYNARKGQNYCQKLVADIYYKAGANNPRKSMATATAAWNAWKVSTRNDNIPRGAAVYFKGTGAAGHVGIYIGNNLVVHAWGKAGVITDTLSSASSKAKGYRGWGWNGGVALVSTNTNTTIGSKLATSATNAINAAKNVADMADIATGISGGSGSSNVSGGSNISGGSGTSGRMTLDQVQAYGGTTLTIADKTGTPEKIQVYHAQSKDSIKKWGLLRYFEEIDTPSIGQNKAATLLELYNRKTRKLTVSDAFGDPNVRAGTLIPVKLNLGDIITDNYMLVEKVTHKFTKDTYTMNLELEGAWDD